MVGLLTAHLLGCHVPHCAHDHAGFGERLWIDGGCRRVLQGCPFWAPFLGGKARPYGTRHQFCQAEVQNLDSTIVGKEQILRFQIAMHNTFVMGRRQAMRELDGVVYRFARRQ